MSTRTGQRGVFAQPTSYGRSESGQWLTYNFDGTKEDVAAQAGVFDALGAIYEVHEGYAFSRLTVHYENNPNVAQEQPVDLWEYVGGEAQKDLLEADVFTGITKSLSQKNIEKIRDAIANPDVETSLTLSSFTDGNPANALTLYRIMLAGVRDYIVQTPVLRHTQIVSRVYPIVLSTTNLNRIYSTSTLIAAEGPPLWAVNGLPTSVPASFQTISASWGWRKMAPAISQIASRKVSIVQEFQYGLWVTSVYGNVI